MTAVTIRPTFSKDTRPSNGLEEISGKLIAKPQDVHYVVGVVKWAGGSLDDEGTITPAVKFLGIEPLTGELADQAKQILDSARKTRGLGLMADSIPQTDPAAFDFDEDGRLRTWKDDDPDGEREVPEASAAELMAERAEAKAAAPVAEFSGGEA